MPLPAKVKSTLADEPVIKVAGASMLSVVALPSTFNSFNFLAVDGDGERIIFGHSLLREGALRERQNRIRSGARRGPTASDAMRPQPFR